MRTLRLLTDRLESSPLSSHAAAALLEDRGTAGHASGTPFSAEWPNPNLFGVLRRQASASRDTESNGSDSVGQGRRTARSGGDGEQLARWACDAVDAANEWPALPRPRVARNGQLKGHG